MSAMFGGVNPSLGRVVGCVDHAYFAFLTCSDLFKNSYECSHVWGRSVHVSAMSPGLVWYVEHAYLSFLTCLKNPVRVLVHVPACQPCLGEYSLPWSDAWFAFLTCSEIPDSVAVSCGCWYTCQPCLKLCLLVVDGQGECADPLFEGVWWLTCS